MTVRKLPAVEDRVETGAIQFGDDWPGLFIRGDNAMVLSLAIGQIVELIERMTWPVSPAGGILIRANLSYLQEIRKQIEEEVLEKGR